MYYTDDILYHSVIMYLTKHCIFFQWSACNAELNGTHLHGSFGGTVGQLKHVIHEVLWICSKIVQGKMNRLLQGYFTVTFLYIK